MEGIRKAAVAGLFYPGSEQDLKQEVDALLDNYKLDFNPEKVFGIISPHAGYVYSGQTAAYAYNLLKGKNYKTVILIAPSHREYFPGISIFSGHTYETPLGKISTNKELSEKITELSDSVFYGLIGHGEHEHSLEVQLPFLQRVLGEFNIVPLVIGDQSRKYVETLADAISEIYSEDIVIVASSDLSHFHKKEECREIDLKVADHINNMNYEELQNDLEENNCEACGGGPIVSLLSSANKHGFSKSKVLHMCDSGDTTGDNTGVVGYLSAVIYE